MKKTFDAHIIKSETCDALFLPNSFRFFEINDNTIDLVTELISGETRENLLSKYNIDNEMLNGLISLLTDRIVPEVKEAPFQSLYKLTINITNDCNLNCVYCYANGGKYRSERNIIDDNTLITSLHLFFNHYDYISNIQLFGGEPTLNLHAVELVGDYLNNNFSDDDPKRPKLCMTTNGMRADDRFICDVNKYKIHLTVSIDGNQAINDKTRIARNGHGVGDILEKNIDKLIKFTSEPKSAEVTYTQFHEDENMSVYKTWKYLKERYAFENIHIVPVASSGEMPCTLYSRKSFIEALPKMILEDQECFMLANSIIQNLFYRKTSPHICEAGLSVFSISTNGDIYPCFMFTDIQEFKVGNVFDASPTFWDNMKDQLKKFEQYNRFESTQCKNCFNKYLCHGCMGNNFINTGDAFLCSKKDCDFLKDLTETIILSLIKQQRKR